MATKGRHIRIDDTLWEDAQTAAGESGETVTTVVRQALEAYVRESRATRGRVNLILEHVRGDYPGEHRTTITRVIRTALRELGAGATDDAIVSYVRGWLRA